MKCLVFRARTIKEATEQAKRKLGKDALILNTRAVSRARLWGLLGRDIFEVIAAVDGNGEKPENKKTTDSFYIPGSLPGSAYQSTAQPKTLPNVAMSPPKPTEDSLEPLQREISEIRKTMDEKLGQILHSMPKDERYPPAIKDILERNNIVQEVYEKILQGIPREKLRSAVSPEVIHSLLVEQIVNILQKPQGITPSPSGCKIVALVGPTGMGKTTTIAKLAANFAMREGYRVGLITADTYRLAAVEQLNKYAEIMDAPLEVVHTPEDMRSAVYRQRDKNIVFIDTAGSSPRNSRQLAETQSILMTIPTVEIYLTMSCTLNYKDALDVIDKFSIFSAEKILFTKLDETDKIGLIVNVLDKYPGRLSYVTCGQEVPSDIELPNVRKLANQILR